MRSIERRFNSIQAENSELGDILCLYKAVQCGKYSRRAINNHFANLISRDDFDTKDKKKLLRQLYEASNCAEDCIFCA